MLYALLLYIMVAGRNCETCQFGYYRKAGIEASDSQPCSPCDCNSDGAFGEDCNKVIINN